MKKIAIVTTGLLPVPATKGGAVENLLDLFLEENEKRGLLDITVLSCYEKNAESLSRILYPHTNFCFINCSTRLYKCLDWIFIQINKIVNLGRLFGFLSALQIRKGDFDLVLVENFPFHCPSLKKMIKIPIWLHTHNRYVRIDFPQIKNFVELIGFLIVFTICLFLVSNFLEEGYAKACSEHALPENFETMEYTEFLAVRRQLMSAVVKRAYKELCK